MFYIIIASFIDTEVHTHI